MLLKVCIQALRARLRKKEVNNIMIKAIIVEVIKSIAGKYSEDIFRRDIP